MCLVNSAVRDRASVLSLFCCERFMLLTGEIC